MADFDNILVFVKVAQFESITRAPRSRGMPITTASRRLSVLESELGVSPLRHTTRRVTLTAPGREYFSQCQAEFCQRIRAPGHGIGSLPATYCEEVIAKGTLIRLLPKWASSPVPVFALYSSRKSRPLRLSVFLEALAAWKRPLWIRE